MSLPINVKIKQMHSFLHLISFLSRFYFKWLNLAEAREGEPDFGGNNTKGFYIYAYIFILKISRLPSWSWGQVRDDVTDCMTSDARIATNMATAKLHGSEDR